jgi:hypothetical protein
MQPFLILESLFMVTKSHSLSMVDSTIFHPKGYSIGTIYNVSSTGLPHLSYINVQNVAYYEELFETGG